MKEVSTTLIFHRPPLPPFICCLDTLGPEGTRGREAWYTRDMSTFVQKTVQRFTLAFLASFSFFALLALAMAAVRSLLRTSEAWFRLAVMKFRSAPTIPRWCFTVRRERFLATSSVIPFLCILR